MIPAFGRREDLDLRDRAYLMTRVLASPERLKLPARKTWRIDRNALNQGSTGTCVGHAWRNFLRCDPLRTERTGPSPYDIYRAAVRLDAWPDNDDEATLPDGDSGLDFGTSVRAGAKAMESLRRLASYLWAFDLQTALQWLLTRGPVVVGMPWYSSFMQPDIEGVVKIEPGAYVLGGHAFLIRGADGRRALARCVNSWGDEYAKSGEFFIPFGDLERLIHENGECCAAVEQKTERG